MLLLRMYKEYRILFEGKEEKRRKLTKRSTAKRSGQIYIDSSFILAFDLQMLFLLLLFLCNLTSLLTFLLFFLSHGYFTL
jgi:hypothetical protein